MASDKNKRSWAVFHTAHQMMQDFGLNRSYFITVTLKGYHRSSYINEKLGPFLDFLRPVFPMILAVHGQREDSAHVHILAVASQDFVAQFGADKVWMNTAVSTLLRKAKAKFKFGRCFDVKPVTQTPEKVAGYLRKNYYNILELREVTRSSTKDRGKALITRGLPNSVVVGNRDICLTTRTSQRFRAAMTRLAELVGVECDDEEGLSRTVGLLPRHIHQGVFRVLRSTPGNPRRWGIAAYLGVFPHLRNYGFTSENSSG